MPEKLIGIVFVFLVCLVVFRMARRISPMPGDKGVRFDAGVLEVLRRRGDPLTAERPVDVYLSLPTADAAREVAEVLTRGGYAVERVEPAPKGKTFACHATKLMLPTLEGVQAMRVELEAIATAHGGEYDGWGCAVAKAS